MLNTIIVFMWTIPASVFFGTLAALLSLFSHTGNAPHLAASTWAKSILAIARVKVRITGLSYIDPKRSYIYMSNHQSNFDIPVLLGYLKVQFRWLAKAELFEIPIFGHGMRGCGYISIDRSNRRSAMESIKQAAETIRNGVSVLIFPEGTRSADGHIQPFKKGGFFLARKSEVPIVPVIIRGTWRVMPRTGLRIAPGNVTVEVRPPIETTAYSGKDKNQLIRDVRQAICEGFYGTTEGSRPC